MKTFTTTFSIKVLMAVSVILFILGIVMIDSAGAGEKRTVSFTKTLAKEVSKNDVSPGDNLHQAQDDSVGSY